MVGEGKSIRKTSDEGLKLEPRKDATDKEQIVFEKLNEFVRNTKHLETAFYQGINEFVELIGEIGRTVVDRVNKKRQAGTLDDSAYSMFDNDYDRIFMTNLVNTLEHFTYGLKELSRKCTDSMTNLFEKELRTE